MLMLGWSEVGNQMVPDDIALLLMAGGRSERFGEQDKLLAVLNGRPLAMHSAERLAQFSWARKIAVCGTSLRTELENLGYETIQPADGNGLGDNISLAARNLTSPIAVLIALADMPFVPPMHITEMVQSVSTDHAIACTEAREGLMPPALIGKAHFHQLVSLSGEQGAKSILKLNAAHVIAIAVPEGDVVDIDTRVDLEKWQDN